MIEISFSADFQVWQATDKEVDSFQGYRGHVRVDPNGYLMATDGHVLACVPCTIAEAPEEWAGAMIPASFFKDLGKGQKGADLCFCITDTEAVALVKSGKLSVPLSSARFPNVARLFQMALDNTKAAKMPDLCNIDPFLMSRAALAIGHSKEVPIPHQWTGKESSVLVFGPKYSRSIALVMPGCQSIARDAAGEGWDLLAGIVGNLGGKVKVAA